MSIKKKTWVLKEYIEDNKEIFPVNFLMLQQKRKFENINKLRGTAYMIETKRYQCRSILNDAFYKNISRIRL